MRIEIKSGIIYLYDGQVDSYFILLNSKTLQQKGLMNLTGASIKPYQPEKLPYCFEVVNATGSSLILKAGTISECSAHAIETSEDMANWQFSIKKQFASVNYNVGADTNTSEYESALERVQ